jgi:hypothetical protein
MSDKFTVLIVLLLLSTSAIAELVVKPGKILKRKPTSFVPAKKIIKKKNLELNLTESLLKEITTVLPKGDSITPNFVLKIRPKGAPFWVFQKRFRLKSKLIKGERVYYFGGQEFVEGLTSLFKFDFQITIPTNKGKFLTYTATNHKESFERAILRPAFPKISQFSYVKNPES